MQNKKHLEIFDCKILLKTSFLEEQKGRTYDKITMNLWTGGGVGDNILKNVMYVCSGLVSCGFAHFFKLEVCLLTPKYVTEYTSFLRHFMRR
jgi:hypothetical protein